MMYLRNSITLRDSWPNTRCPKCGDVIDLDPCWKDTRIGWSEVLVIAIELCGPPTAFWNRDFLIVIEFGEITLTFCGQGSRRGEIEISVEDDGMRKAFLDRIRAVVEKEDKDL